MVLKDLISLLKALTSDLRRDLNKVDYFYIPYKASTLERKYKRR